MDYSKLMTEKQKSLYWQKVDIRGEDECWPWNGTHNGDPRESNRRGIVCLSYERHVASRIAWSLHHKKDIPDDLHACHSCDQGLCMNPRHIFLGTQADNMRDASRKGRTCRGSARTNPNDPAMAKLTEEKVIMARYAYVNGLMRVCELARLFGVTHATMGLAIHGKQWKHVPMLEETG